jgi:tRNA pseudouridine38-40 synthase
MVEPVSVTVPRSGPTTTRYRMDLQYDGEGFFGWARQPGTMTVQGALEAALGTVLGMVPALSVAGRTDTGVHAYRQVVSLDLPDMGPQGPLDPFRLIGSLNALTPFGLAVVALVPARPGFDARHDATSRSYRYFITPGPVQSPFRRAYAWHVGYPLDVAAMAATSRIVLGRHDFTAFTPALSERAAFVRTVDRCSWRLRGDLLWLEVRSTSFLRHMVRSLVGTMVEVGRGRLGVADMERFLLGAPRVSSGPTAPPHGLFLWRVTYAGEPEMPISSAPEEELEEEPGGSAP